MAFLQEEFSGLSIMQLKLLQIIFMQLLLLHLFPVKGKVEEVAFQ
jgi:hypothetical protein